MNFQDTFLCSLRNRNDECLDSPPRAEANISVSSSAAKEKQQPHEDGDDDDDDDDGDILRRSRARMEERAQFLKECEKMMIKTTTIKKNLPGTLPMPTTSPSFSSTLPGGRKSSAISTRMQKLWDFNDTDDDANVNTALLPQQHQERKQQSDDDRDDVNDTNYPSVIQEKDIDNDDDDDDEKLWPSTKIRRESRRAKLGIQTMHDKQELTEVELFVAEMRRKRMAREAERLQNNLQKQPLPDDDGRDNEEMMENELEKNEHERSNDEQMHTKKNAPYYVGINRDTEDDDIDDDLEEYTAIRNTEVVPASPRDARLQRIRKWKNANHHPVTTATSSSMSTAITHRNTTTSSARSATSTKTPAKNTSTTDEVVGSWSEADSTIEKHTSLTDVELKKWWNEHKRSTNHIQVSMPSFEELVDEPTISTSTKRIQQQQPQVEQPPSRTVTSSSTTAMRIEQLRFRRNGGRGDHPPHPEDGSISIPKQP